MQIWCARLNFTFYWGGEVERLSDVVQAESFAELVLVIQENVADCSIWIQILPCASNPAIDLEDYAVALRRDTPGFPWGEEVTIRDYFEVRVADEGLWIYSHAQEKIFALLD